MKLVLLVCTGNVCRSPMAEYLLRQQLGTDSGWLVASAGTAAMDGCPASREGITALAERGIDMNAHASRPVTAELVASAELIVVMTHGHLHSLTRRFPAALGKTRLLKSFVPGAEDEDVADPIGLPVAAYRKTRDEIAAAMPGLAEFLRRGGAHAIQN